MKVLLTDTYLGEPSLERELLEREGVSLIVASSPSLESLVEHDVDAILNCTARVPGEVFERLPNLRIVVRYGIGVDNINVEAATQAGVMVVNVPDYCLEEVATHALAMVLDCNRQLTWHHRAMVEGEKCSYEVPCRRLSTQTLGVVGLGRIGSRVARMALGLGMRVVGYDPRVASDPEGELKGVEHIPLSSVLASADFLTLHVPLTRATEKLIDKDALNLMKPTAYVVNTSRGPVIDVEALLDALNEGRLAGAALDVFPVEPLPHDSPLRTHPKVILTPHTAWFSPEARDESRTKAVRFVLEALRGEVPSSVVNRLSD